MSPRKCILMKAIMSISTRYGLSLWHFGCRESKRPCDKFVRCLIQDAAAHEWTASSVKFSATPYWLVTSRLHDTRRRCKLHASTTRSLARLDSAGLILFHNFQAFRRNHSVCISWGKRFKGRIGQRLCNPTIYAIVNSIDQPDWDRATGCYTSACWLLTWSVESVESRLTFARGQATLDVWVGMVGAIMVLDIGGSEECCLPVTGSQSSLTERDYPDQTEHNVCEVRKGQSTQVLRWFLGLQLYVLSSTLCQTPICTTRWLRRKSRQAAAPGGVSYFGVFVFVRRGYLQYEGCGCRGSYSVSCHTYLPLLSYHVERTVAIT